MRRSIQTGNLVLIHQLFRTGKPFLTGDEGNEHLKETKLLEIHPAIKLEDSGEEELVEERDGDNLTLLHLRSVETEEERRRSRSILNCYDMGGHMQYYCAQQIFRNQSSIYLLTYQRYGSNLSM